MRGFESKPQRLKASSSACTEGGHLDEVASLLVLGLTRLLARRQVAEEPAQSTGLLPQTERVSGPENYP